MGYLPWVGASAGLTPVEVAEVWDGSQLVLTTIEDASLVLDCLLPPFGQRKELGGWTTGVPVTVRAHPTHRYMCARNVERLVQVWVETGAPVDIALLREGDTPLLQIGDGTSLFTLELEYVSNPRRGA